jgi:hypothetical protein
LEKYKSEYVRSKSDRYNSLINKAYHELEKWKLIPRNEASEALRNLVLEEVRNMTTRHFVCLFNSPYHRFSLLYRSQYPDATSDQIMSKWDEMLDSEDKDDILQVDRYIEMDGMEAVLEYVRTLHNM